MEENLTCLSKFQQHSSQKCSLVASVSNAGINIFMLMLWNFVDLIL